MIFVERKVDCKQVARELRYCESIHGDRPQAARERALNDFRHNNINVLVATEVAARGSFFISFNSYDYNYFLMCLIIQFLGSKKESIDNAN